MDSICNSQCPRLFIRPITTLPYKQNDILVVMYEQVIKGSPLDDIVSNMQGLECYFHPITTLHHVDKMIHYGGIA